jgi:hypothetical protein
VDKKKNKRNIKKNKTKQGGKIPTTAGHVGSNQLVIVNQVGNIDEVHNATKTTHKPKFPCRICKGGHLINYFPGIPKILYVCSTSSKQPISSASIGHASDKPQTSEIKVGEKKSRFKFPCRLCEGSHQIHLFPHMDED